MTSLATNATDEFSAREAARRVVTRAAGSDAAIGAALGGALALLAFVTTGGVDLGPNTWAEIVLTVVGAGLGVAAVRGAGPGRAWGIGTLSVFAALTALTVVSITWSLQPSDSWVESSRAVSYLAAFGGAVALARLMPARWPAIVGSVAVLATVVCGYSLLAKVFPATFDALDPLARVSLPFNYWNAVGVLAALGLPACLWAGARPGPARALRALAVPAVSLLLTALVLSYSRSAVLAAVIGLGCWFAFVPLRLRAVLVLAVGAAGAGGAIAWALATHPVTHDRAPLAARTIAGHGFGLLLVLVLVLTTIGGAAAAFSLDRVTLPDYTRRRIGRAMIVLVAIVPLAGVGAVAASSRGLTGEISHVWKQLTNPNPGGGVGDEANRLLAVDNSRGRYWNEALTVGKHNLLEGVGAGAFGTARRRYTSDPLDVQHAHGYLFETFADLGLLGVFASLALLLAWGVAALRAVGSTAPRRRRRVPAGARVRARPQLTADQRAEQAGLLTLLAAVVTFGVQSAVDWTWFVPGTAIPALVCAGWLAGRGPLERPVGRARERKIRLRTPAMGAALTALVAVVILCAWAMLQPLRSQDADAAAITALSNRNAAAALSDARTAANSNPLSVDPLEIMSVIYTDLHDYGPARAELVQATKLQPQNAQPWVSLGEYDLTRRHFDKSLADLRVAAYLDQGSVETRHVTAEALTAQWASPVSAARSQSR